MKQQEMRQLLDVSDRTLRDWKNGKRSRLYKLLERLDFEEAQRLVDDEAYVKVLENEKYFLSLRDFEKHLYPLLAKENKEVWLRLSKDEALTESARARSAYLYSFLSKKKLASKSNSKTRTRVAFYHGNRPTTDEAFVKYYGLKNGLNTARFEQFRNTGAF